MDSSGCRLTCEQRQEERRRVCVVRGKPDMLADCHPPYYCCYTLLSPLPSSPPSSPPSSGARPTTSGAHFLPQYPTCPHGARKLQDTQTAFSVFSHCSGGGNMETSQPVNQVQGDHRLIPIWFWVALTDHGDISQVISDWN